MNHKREPNNPIPAECLPDFHAYCEALRNVDTSKLNVAIGLFATHTGNFDANGNSIMASQGLMLGNPQALVTVLIELLGQLIDHSPTLAPIIAMLVVTEVMKRKARGGVPEDPPNLDQMAKSPEMIEALKKLLN